MHRIKHLHPKFSFWRVLIVDMEAGIVPYNKFSLKSNSMRFGKLPMVSGIPVNWFCQRLRTCKEVMLEMLAGITPCKLLFCKTIPMTCVFPALQLMPTQLHGSGVTVQFSSMKRLQRGWTLASHTYHDESKWVHRRHYKNP